MRKTLKIFFQYFVNWNSPPTYDTYTNAKDLIEVSFLLYGQEVEQKVNIMHL
jgi:hypothetical protein